MSKKTTRAALIRAALEGVPVAAATVVLMLIGACNAPEGTTLSSLQAAAQMCPRSELVEYVGDDVSGSGQQDTIDASRMATLVNIATEVAACNGHLHIDAFTGSAAASSVVFDGDLKPPGATEIARLRKVTSLVDTTIGLIRSRLDTASKTLPPDGSDITSQFGMASQFYDQLTGHVELHVDLLTDGVQTVGVVLNTQHLTAAAAADLAATTTVSPLPATAVVKISGLGRTAGSAPPTSYTDALRTFYKTYCQRTGAASCVAVTDYTA